MAPTTVSDGSLAVVLMAIMMMAMNIKIRKRMSVYSTMLEHMSDEQKITVTAKIAQEVLSAAIEGGLPIATGNNSSASSPDPSGIDSAAFLDGKSRKGREGRELKARRKASAVVKDALTVMASPGIRVGGKGGAAAGDIDDGSGTSGFALCLCFFAVGTDSDVMWFCWVVVAVGAIVLVGRRAVQPWRLSWWWRGLAVIVGDEDDFSSSHRKGGT